MSWANKCQKILKILALPSQESFLFTTSCWLQRWRKSVDLITYSYLSECKKLISPFLKGVGSSDACASTPWFREARKLRGDSAEGEPKAVSLSCPTQVSQAHTIFPGSLLPVILGAAASFWDHLSLSLSLCPLGSSPSPLTPPRASQNWVRCDSTKGLHKSQRQGNGVIEHQSWSHGGWWEAFRNKYCILKKVLLNLCSKFQE